MYLILAFYVCFQGCKSTVTSSIFIDQKSCFKISLIYKFDAVCFKLVSLGFFSALVNLQRLLGKTRNRSEEGDSKTSKFRPKNWLVFFVSLTCLVAAVALQ